MKALNLSTSLAAREKECYKQFMTVDYMSSEKSMSESEEGESNSDKKKVSNKNMYSDKSIIKIIIIIV